MAPAEGAVADTATTTAAPDSTTTSTSTGTQAPSQPAPKWEDTPQYKGQVAELQKERKARQEHERRIAEYESNIKERDRRIAALAGVTPVDPKQADNDTIRQKLRELEPGLARLDSLDKIEAALEAQEVASAKTHSRSMLGQLYSGISAELGGDLTDGQRKLISNLYFAANYNSPEVHERHNQGDPALIAEFVKEFVENIVEPVKRKTMSSEAARFRPVPGGRDRSTPIKGEKILKGEDMLRAHFKEKTR